MEEIYLIEIKKAGLSCSELKGLGELSIPLVLSNSEPAILEQKKASQIGGLYLSSNKQENQTYFLEFARATRYQDEQEFLKGFSGILKSNNVRHKITKTFVELEEDFYEEVLNYGF